MQRPVLLLALLAASLAASCDGHPSSRTSIERQIYVEDLLPGLAEDAAGGAFTLELPAGAALELAGSLRPAEGSAPAHASARFAIRQDDRLVLDRVLESSGGPAGFTAVVPLQGGRRSALSLEIEADPPDAVARWTWLSLLRLEEVRRLEATDGPNLLLLVVDTLRADHLGLHGYARDTSPNLDRFAADAAVFDRAISASSWTHPATASLLTGLTPAQHGVLGGARLSPFAASLPQLLQAAGFTTFGFAANPVIGRGSGFHRGFETFQQAPWARADAVNHEFLGWLDGRQGLRWFAYLHYIDPHSPYDAPGPPGREFTGGYRGPLTDAETFQALVDRVNEDGELPDLAPAEVDYLIGAYDGEIRFWDRELGVLLAALEDRGQLRNTVVVITSDHGEEFLEHGKLKHGLQLFDESIHVPLIVRAPAGLPAGRRPEQVETRGLMRTLLDLLRVPAGDAEIERLPSLLDGVRRPAISHTTLPFRKGDPERRALVSVRDRRWKLILNPQAGTVELYDLDADPQETQDVADGYPEVASGYRELLESYLRTADTPPRATTPIDDETARRLRALGYVQ